MASKKRGKPDTVAAGEPDAGAGEATTEPRLPKWLTEDLIIPFRAGIAHEFVVHGDTNCLVPNPDAEDEPDQPYINLRRFFEKLWDERPMVIFYNIASGLQFLTPEMEKRFKALAGLEEKADDGDPIAKAKAGLAAKRGLPREPEACLPLIEKALKTMDNVAVAVQSVHFIATGGGPGGALTPVERTNIERLKNWAQDEEIESRGNIVLLMTDQAAKVSPELRQSGSQVRTVFIPKPDRDARLEYVRSITVGAGPSEKDKSLKALRAKLKRAKSGREAKEIGEEIESLENQPDGEGEKFGVPDGFDAESFAHATQGLSLRQIHDIFLRCRDTSEDLDLKFVKQKKVEILNEEFGDILEVVEPKRGLEDIGGNDHIKAYFEIVLDALRRGEPRRVPMGVTLMGPPGTGKTAIIEALAKEAGFNFVKTKNIRSMWVGESEAKSERLKYALRSLAPVVVMNDEADLGDAKRDSPKGDSGVSERLLRDWMTLLSDPNIRGQILVINATNRVDRMDAALVRSGRSDIRILMPMPDIEERTAIFGVMFRRHDIPTDLKDFGPFAEATSGRSGSDIEAIVLKSFDFAGRAREDKVAAEQLNAAIEDSIPSGSQYDIDLMTLTGLAMCSSKELLPKNRRKIVKEIQERNLVENLDEIVKDLKTRKII
jgi:SpoVK/Ycf46/Vps4 family AAA+-type ATPase